MIHIEHDEYKPITDLLMGRRVVKVEGHKLWLDNGLEVEVEPNEGCGDCPAGWYGLKSLATVENIITRVEFEAEDVTGDDKYADPAYVYRVFVFADDVKINLLTVAGDDGNGYYGTGYELIVREAK